MVRPPGASGRLVRPAPADLPPLKALRLRAGRRRPRILAGHLWAYRSEIEGLEGVAAGDVVDLLDPRGRLIGRGTANPRSEISFRLLSRRAEAIDEAFFDRALERAAAVRRGAGLEGEPHRVVFSEGDLLPGYVVDRYPLRGAGAGVLVVQIGTAGAEALREAFLAALGRLFPGDAVYERSDSPSRAKEGLGPRAGPVRDAPSWTGEVVETAFDGILAAVDVVRGQKTGAFLDVREMRRHLRARAAGARVLDAFAHIGLFGRYAAAGGAREVVAVETDAAAAAAIRAALPAATVVEENAFDLLRSLERSRERFDVVVLDPPPFTKDARSVAGARRGYKEINLRALKVLAPGGLLYTSSCSFHLSREAFVEVLGEAAADAGRVVRIEAVFGAAPDHPVLLGVPETDYLKGFALRSVENRCAGA